MSLRDAHESLMARYVSLLDLLDQYVVTPKGPADPEPRRTTPPVGSRRDRLNRWLERKFPDAPRTPSTPERATRYRRRIATRLFLEWHIRSQLRDLVRIFAQREHSYAVAPPLGVTIPWVTDARRSMSELASTMTLWANVRGVATLLAPAVIGSVVASFGATSIWNLVIGLLGWRPADALDLTFVLFAVLFGLIYLLTGAALAIERARGLLLIRSSMPVVVPTDAENLEGANTYVMEDCLYRVLEKPKRSAVPVETWLYVLAAIGWAVLEAWIGFRLVDGTWGRAFFVAFALVFLVLAGVGVRSIRKREFR
jgi:hypothetical protein